MVVQVINKANLIKKYVVKALSEYGFDYVGKEGDRWLVQRKLEGVVQTIAIFLYRFDRSMITFELFTDEVATGFVRPCDIGGIETNDDRNYWRFEDKDSLIEVLICIKDIIIEQGIRILDFLSAPIDSLVTIGMSKRLYYEHEQLGNEFKEYYHLDDSIYDEENINAWFSVIEHCFETMHEKSRTDVREELLKMSAFLGNQLEKHMGGKWTLVENGKLVRCLVEQIRTNSISDSIKVLGLLSGDYEDTIASDDKINRSYLKDEMVQVCRTRF